MHHLFGRITLACVFATCMSSSLAAQTFPGGRVQLPTFITVANGDSSVDARAVAPETTADGRQVVTKPKGPPPTPRHTGFKAMAKAIAVDFKHLPSRQNLFWTGVGGGLALAVHPVDDNVNKALVNSDFAEVFFKPGEVLGQLPTLLSAASITYAIGRIKDHPRVSHMGSDLIESLVVSEVMTQTLKFATHRQRPDGSGDNSFPSGHAADTFAFATALERHLGWKGAVPAYIFSSYVAISRLPANRHWLSDAVFGSAVGIIAGRTVTRHGREFPVTVSAVPGGAAIVFIRHPWTRRTSRVRTPTSTSATRGLAVCRACHSPRLADGMANRADAALMQIV